MLFPSLKTAEECRLFVLHQLPHSTFKVRVQHVTEVFSIPLDHEIFALVFSEDQKGMVKKYWMFSGGGISSRFAEQCLLRLIGDEQHEEFKLGLPRHPDHPYYEYYQIHSPLSTVKDAKAAIRTRYAGFIEGGGNIRGVPGVSTEDVFLYPTGMAAIWNCHKLLSATTSSKFGSNGLKHAHIK